MNRQKVESSNIASVGYDSQTSTLEIEFHSGATYQYFDVPRKEFVGLLNAPSVGKYFLQHVKGAYNFTKL